MDKILYTVYKVTNQINGKFYIGAHKTRNLDDDYMGSGKLLLLAQNKYGIDKFKKEILHVFETSEEMFAKEAEIVTEDFLAEENTYNLGVGGQGGFDWINSNIPLRKEKNRRAAKTTNAKRHVWFTNAIGENISEGLRRSYQAGRKKCSWSKEDLIEFQLRSQSKVAMAKRKETYKKIEHQIGKRNSQFGSMWITNGVENKKIKGIDIPIGFRKGRTILSLYLLTARKTADNR